MQPVEEQVVPEGQTFPHLPQLLSSKALSMHVPLQIYMRQDENRQDNTVIGMKSQ